MMNNTRHTMKFGDKFSYYFGICGVVVSIGIIIAMVVIGWYTMIGKMVLALVLCASMFAKGLRAKRLVEASNEHS